MKILLFALIIGAASIFSAEAQFNYLGTSASSLYSSNNASINFKNESDYTMTIRIVYAKGGHYSTVTLYPHSSQKVTFSRSDSFKLKIKAKTSYGHISYHDGGNFSVTCTNTEWTEGEMSFTLSSYGNGLGPSISAKQFESNY